MKRAVLALVLLAPLAAFAETVFYFDHWSYVSGNWSIQAGSPTTFSSLLATLKAIPTPKPA